MQRTLSWFEIPAVDFEKQKAFYEAVLEIQIHSQEMGDCVMGFIGGEGSNVGGAIVKHANYKPSADGVNIYFYTEDINAALERIEKAGGKVYMPKTLISPEIGYFAIFGDLEGNRLSLHSAQ